MDLAEIHEELVEEVRNGLSYLAEPARMAELGDVFDTLALQLEGLAICHLFDRADEAQFRENMARAGQSRRFFLRRSKQEKNDDDRHLALSRTGAFLDALVAGILPLARDIALLSTEQWKREWEYEDDFCFFLLLHTIVKQPEAFPTPAAQLLLERFERALEGGKSAHLDVAKALAARDRHAFSEALGSLLVAEERKIDEDRDSAAVHERDILFWPKSRVSIEGLALLQIGDLLGMRIDDELPLCPKIARLPWTDQPVRDLFEEIERIG
jgi:hypothetical protein